MNIAARSSNDVCILDLEGKITMGESCVALRHAIRERVRLGQKHMLLNMRDVSYMDSSGTGELVGAYASVTSQGGQLKLLNLTARLRELLAITKLLTVFECYDNESQALNTFFR
ncbi:MAG: STAS domain-containing protein [Acidobacteria bacterium]|nr:STAS domain-containing protein [Acidobacteriota bacterium]